MDAFGSAVPLKIGFEPTFAPAAGVEITGTSVVASTVNDLAAEDTAPAVATMLCAPLPSAVAGVKLQAPVRSVVAVPTVVVPSFTVTTDPAAALPLTSGKGPIVVPSAGAVIVGTSSVPSTVKVRAVEVAVLPTASVAVAVIVCCPALSAVVGV